MKQMLIMDGDKISFWLGSGTFTWLILASGFISSLFWAGRERFWIAFGHKSQHMFYYTCFVAVVAN